MDLFLLFRPKADLDEKKTIRIRPNVADPTGSGINNAALFKMFTEQPIENKESHFSGPFPMENCKLRNTPFIKQQKTV